jgi:hypothetical protein
MFRKRSKGPHISREEALSLTPVRGPKVREEKIDELVRLSHPLPVKPWVTALLHRFGKEQKPQPRKTLELDEMGSEVWKHIDGKTSVQEICTAFQKRYDVHRQEAEASVTAFLRELGRRGIIGMKEKD